MKLSNNIDPTTYKLGWEKAQKEFETFQKAQYQVKTRRAIERLKKGEIFSPIIEAA